MIPAEGRVAILEALVDQPMLLCLFLSGPKGEDASAADFKECEDCEPRTVKRRDWLIDGGAGEASIDAHTFEFDATGSKVGGWLLLRVKDRALVAFEHFASPYPINSDEDTVKVRARIRLSAPA